MATIRQIKGRIKSAKNISQITKAMQMVSAAKMRKAQDAAEKGKPYSEKIREAVIELASKIDPKLHPLLRAGNPTGKSLYILVSTNKGLCGGLNTNLFRSTKKWIQSQKNSEFITIGKKGQNFVIRSKWDLEAHYADKHPVEHVDSISTHFINGYLDGTYKDVYIIYNQFVNSITQTPHMTQILPLTIPVDPTIDESEYVTHGTFTIEPSDRRVLNKLLPHYVETQIRSAFLEAEASEHSARMVAMKNATDNAKNLISDLTLTYNGIRQEKITTEIADIVTARESIG